ncbi:helix-turn-helix domain-containing protein [Pseudanabaena sp. PCC 6802]|uniref:helix-turn-helix domain-containing protein n=1 Tax=Pseudanabaena sp. PCC 6802 TaxID=118173 RepID=UPI000346CD13|nr:helix-turn-helix domain-containing protein [Pseudanabaena sp. PCC 6802]
MKTIIPHQIECARLPISSSRDRGWETILVQQFQNPAGEGNFLHHDEHTLSFSLSPRPVRMQQTQAGKTFSGLFGKGHISITPAQVPFFARWDSDDRYLQIRIASQFIQNVARETIDSSPDRLELLTEFRVRDPQIEAIAMMLLSELQQENPGSRLYIESLANVLAVHLIRQYTAVKPHIPLYEGGLPQRELMQVLDYIHAHLDRDIKLSDLAALLEMSQFHFSRSFKQAIGTTPYQYLLQQRIERAKQLLKQSDRSIVDIALSCGFNSHSHLSQQFRQVTGMTPKTYRAE